MKKEDALKNIINSISNDFNNILEQGIMEHKERFPYTIAVANFIGEMYEKNIILDYNTTFDDFIIDMIIRETSSYIGR